MKLKELFENTKLNRSIKITDDEIENGRFKDDYRNIDLTGDFDCQGCTSLKSLEGAPDSVTGGFYCQGCTSLKSLEGIGKKYIHEIREIIYLPNTIKSNILGLLKITGLKEINIDIEDLKTIVNKHLKSDRNLRKCKLELEEAGLQGFAKL